MALKGADILKLLPKTNTKDCGFPTCFAFAMKLAKGEVKIDDCPHITPENRAKLEAALAPPMVTVTIGTGDEAFKTGGEEVLFRHDKTFFNETAIALLVSDKEDGAEIDRKIKQFNGFAFDRIGRKMPVHMLALSYESGDPAKYEALVKKAVAETKAALLLVCCETDLLLAMAAVCADRRPIAYPVTKDNVATAAPRLKELNAVPGVFASSVEDLAELTPRLKEAGIEQMVIDPGPRQMPEAVRDQTLIRRAALKKNFRPLGYPTIAFPCLTHPDPMKQVLAAAALVTKYAGIIVLNQFEEKYLLPLLVYRFNIYSDPRRPMTVDEKVYEILEPDENAPILISTNYALDYFIVSGAIEEAGIPSYLCIKNTEGLGVLASWTSGKFNGEAIAQFFDKYKMKDKVSHRKMIIPGVARKLKEELEEELPDWEVILGPQEASDIPKFMAEAWKG